MEWGRILIDAKLGAWRVRLGLEPDALGYRRALARKHGYPLTGLDFAGRPTGKHSPMLVLCPREFMRFRGAASAIDYQSP